MKPSAYIAKIRFKSGQELQIAKGDKVVIVGANNCGKSLSLREIVSSTRGDPSNNRYLIDETDISKSGSKADFDGFLGENSDMRDGFFYYKTLQIQTNQTANWDVSALRVMIHGFFVKYVGAETRLQTAMTKSSIGPDQRSSTPQHIMFQNAALFKKVSGFFRQAFGHDLMFDFRGGSKIPIHVGELPDVALVNQVSDEYVAAIRRNPNLDQQGDGMKSYAGLLSLRSAVIGLPEKFYGTGSTPQCAMPQK